MDGSRSAVYYGLMARDGESTDYESYLHDHGYYKRPDGTTIPLDVAIIETPDGTVVPLIDYHGTHIESGARYGNPIDEGSRKHRVRALGARRLASLMERYGLTAAEVAARSGINRATIKRYRNGSRAIPRDPDLMMRLLEAFPGDNSASAIHEQIQRARIADRKRCIPEREWRAAPRSCHRT